MRRTGAERDGRGERGGKGGAVVLALRRLGSAMALRGEHRAPVGGTAARGLCSGRPGSWGSAAGPASLRAPPFSLQEGPVPVRAALPPQRAHGE